MDARENIQEKQEGTFEEQAFDNVCKLDEQEVREYGSRAHHGNFIGEAWEKVGQEILTSSLGEKQMWVDEKEKSAQPVAILFLDTDPEVKSAVRALKTTGKKGDLRGIKVADFVVIEVTQDNEIRLRPGDFKFELAAASPSQITQRTFAELWNEAPIVRQRILTTIQDAENIPQLIKEKIIGLSLNRQIDLLRVDVLPLVEEHDIPLDPSGVVLLGPGFFFSPATEGNEAFLKSKENIYTHTGGDKPTGLVRIPEANVKMCGFDAPEIKGMVEFLSKGPGWGIVIFLEDLDRLREEERGKYKPAIYYAKIAAGLQVTMQEIITPLFGESEEYTVELVTENLANYCAQEGIQTSYDIVISLDEVRAQKRELLKRAEEIVGSIYDKRWGIKGQVQRLLFSPIEKGGLGYKRTQDGATSYVEFPKGSVSLTDLFDAVEAQYQTRVNERSSDFESEELRRRGWEGRTLSVKETLEVEGAILGRFSEYTSQKAETVAMLIKRPFKEELTKEKIDTLLEELIET